MEKKQRIERVGLLENLPQDLYFHMLDFCGTISLSACLSRDLHSSNVLWDRLNCEAATSLDENDDENNYEKSLKKSLVFRNKFIYQGNLFGKYASPVYLYTVELHIDNQSLGQLVYKTTAYGVQIYILFFQNPTIFGFPLLSNIPCYYRFISQKLDTSGLIYKNRSYNLDIRKVAPCPVCCIYQIRKDDCKFCSVDLNRIFGKPRMFRIYTMKEIIQDDYSNKALPNGECGVLYPPENNLLHF